MARIEALYKAVYKGDQKAAVAAAKAALKAKTPIEALTNESLIPAMKKIGSDFEDGKVFIPEMLVAARAMDGVMKLLEPLLAESGTALRGKVCIGTVKGDLHDVGKNLVAMILKGAGFEVIDLGVDCPPEKFVEAVKNGAQVACLSALLTTTMPEMKEVIEGLKSCGLDVPVVIGGAPVTQHYAEEIGANGYGETANSAVNAVEACLGLAG